jgi:CheY-like chemotaxis protein
LWRLDADAGQISQVLHNLLINATQAMPGGGVLRITALNETVGPANPANLRSGNYLKITIEDQGCGITPENLPRIFDPYFTTKSEGSGLGLASAYSIIKRHGGAIEVSSTEGVGSCFTIHLPAVSQGSPAGEAIGEESELAGNGRVLVMDDEEIIREVATEILEYAGFQVECCVDGKEAVERYRISHGTASPFDAVIMDLTIPGGMGGREAADLILEIDPAAALIVSSGYSNDKVIADFRHYGFRGAVIKPFSAGELAGEVQRLIRLNRWEYE